MSIRTRKNLFRGINPHLLSTYQANRTWSRFHNVYISDLARHIRELARPLGYAVEVEDSIQVMRLDTFEERATRADVLISDPFRRSRAGNAPTGEWVLEELIADEAETFYSAIALYDRRDSHAEPVSWIELLSPTNKSNSPDASHYLVKRRDLLAAGIGFVELDFLHETPSTFRTLADYTRQQVDSHTYRVSALHPAEDDWRKGRGDLREFDVDMAIPSLSIPLNENDFITVNFDQCYQSMYLNDFRGDDVDYTQLPLHFDRYSPADQQRIVNKMLAIIQAHQAGKDLETVELQVVEYSLEDGLQKLKQATG
jgi:hypothetical protein